MVAGDPLHPLERSGAIDLCRGIRTFHGVFVKDAQIDQEVEHAWAGLLRREYHRVLVRRVDTGPPGTPGGDHRCERILWVTRAEHVVLHVGAGEFATGMK